MHIWELERLFSCLVKKPVREYIKLRRLTRAREVLKSKDNRIIDVAMEYGFDSHAAFTKAFRRVYGLSPSQYRSNTAGLTDFSALSMPLSNVMAYESEPSISDRLVLELNSKTLEEPIDFVGVSSFLPFEKISSYDQDANIDVHGEVWQLYDKKKYGLPIKTNGLEISVSFSGEAPEGYYTFFAGGEAKNNAKSDGFEVWTLSAQEYIVCSLNAETFDEPWFSANKKVHNYTDLWLDKYDFNRDGFGVTMHYRNTGLSGVYMELWIPLIS